MVLIIGGRERMERQVPDDANCVTTDAWVGGGGQMGV